MKLPAEYQLLSLNSDPYEVPYPPLGFYSFAEHQLGNGDTFGLYWPIGREDDTPIVAETYHDVWTIQPKFSSLNRFLEFTSKYSQDEESLIETPSIKEDPQSPAACIVIARESLKLQQIDMAIKHLEIAVSILPEFNAAHAMLCSLYRRIGDIDAAVTAAIRAIISPPCFGSPQLQVANWLARQTTCSEETVTDPIWVNRKRLSLKFGGVKENDEYVVLHASIDSYLEQSASVQAMTLMQTYAEYMYSETVSFRERYGFDVKEFISRQYEVSNRLGKCRKLILPTESP